MKKPEAELPIVTFPTAGHLDVWLEKHHASSRGVWLRLAKKGSDETTVTYAEAVEIALCWGWIDGQKKSHDDVSWLQKFTARGPNSVWSKINHDKAQALIASGEMKAPGLAAIERAKANGRWAAAYDPQSRAKVPDDLRAALDASPRAKAFFATLDSANRYAVLFRVHTANKPETRAKRIARFVEMLAAHQKLHG